MARAQGQRVTHPETGLQFPVKLGESLYGFSYSRNGYRLARVEEKARSEPVVLSSVRAKIHQQPDALTPEELNLSVDIPLSVSPVTGSQYQPKKYSSGTDLQPHFWDSSLCAGPGWI